MEPTFYIIMRSDLPDCNPGKGMAQAAHAQAEFDSVMSDLLDPERVGPIPAILIDYAEWLEGRAFGRTIVLSASLKQLETIVHEGTVAGLTVDPTYPWKNFYGELQITEEATCAWIFVSDDTQEDLELVSSLPLHR